ncbi:MAG: hypothetical protein IKR28_08010 [Selenomonadaceae bacterium]|nr:hypothetical protein [Selenomonadaceae bacterium]
MKYHFRAGREKNVTISENETFETLGFMILEAYKIYPDHLFLFEFENGDFTDSASPLGPMNDGIGNVPIETKIKDRNMEIGEEMKFVYDFSSNWSRKVKLIEKL